MCPKKRSEVFKQMVDRKAEAEFERAQALGRQQRPGPGQLGRRTLFSFYFLARSYRIYFHSLLSRSTLSFPFGDPTYNHCNASIVQGVRRGYREYLFKRRCSRTLSSAFSLPRGRSRSKQIRHACPSFWEVFIYRNGWAWMGAMGEGLDWD